MDRLTLTAVSRMTVAVLRQHLVERSLPTDGNKKDLVQRLRTWVLEAEQSRREQEGGGGALPLLSPSGVVPAVSEPATHLDSCGTNDATLDTPQQPGAGREAEDEGEDEDEDEEKSRVDLTSDAAAPPSLASDDPPLASTAVVEEASAAPPLPPPSRIDSGDAAEDENENGIKGGDNVQAEDEDEGKGKVEEEEADEDEDDAMKASPTTDGEGGEKEQEEPDAPRASEGEGRLANRVAEETLRVEKATSGSATISLAKITQRTKQAQRQAEEDGGGREKEEDEEEEDEDKDEDKDEDEEDASIRSRSAKAEKRKDDSKNESNPNEAVRQRRSRLFQPLGDIKRGKMMEPVCGAKNTAKLVENNSAAKAREPATRALRIDNFVRPFTDLALKSLLESGGEDRKEEDDDDDESEERTRGTAVSLLRLDSKKTHCYVVFPSVARAQWVRNAVYNFRWPLPHGHQLRPKFVSLEEARGQRMNEETKKSRSDSVDQPLSLDDIFMKTTAEPPLYYLPLTEEQARARLKRKENDKQDEEERARAMKRRRMRGGEEGYGERARMSYRAGGGGAPMRDRSRDRRNYRGYRR